MYSLSQIREGVMILHDGRIGFSAGTCHGFPGTAGTGRTDDAPSPVLRHPAGRQINHRTVSAWRPSFLFLLEGDNRMQCTGNRVFPAMERKTARKIIFRHASGLFFQIERPGCFCSSSGCYLCFWKFFYRAGFLWK